MRPLARGPCRHCRFREHFAPTPDGAWTARSMARALVRFARLTAMGAWPMCGTFHAILCRRGMIDCGMPAREPLVSRLLALRTLGEYHLVEHARA